MKSVILSILLLFSTLSALADVVQKPTVERLVNDFANVITNSTQLSLLEDSLCRYARRTSTQIVVVTVSDLNGYDVAEYAYRIGQTWGVGQKGKNNGVVILVKPKLSDTDKGRAFIAPGYGLEGVLPDITCSHIVNNEMIPYFRQNNYQAGIVAAAIAVMKACEGEYEGDPLDEDEEGSFGLGMFIMILLLFYLVSKNDKNNGKKNSRMSSGGGLAEAIILSNMMRNSRNSNWGSFSGGSGSFGGFGGGAFGGGGGGGSW